MIYPVAQCPGAGAGSTQLRKRLIRQLVEAGADLTAQVHVYNVTRVVT